MSIWLRLRGYYPATEVGAHSPITWETAASGGSFRASWEFSLAIRGQHQAIRDGSLVEVMCGPLPIWSGILDYPDQTTQTYTAYGFAAQAQSILALDAGGSPTRNIGTAITQAITRGWGVTNPLGIAGTAAGTATGNPTSLGKLLDDYATQTSQFWGVDGQRRLYMTPRSTSPTWLASPGASAFGTASEDRATRLAGRYLDSGTSLYATAFAGSGFPEEATDELLDKGAMTNTAAVAYLNGMLSLGKKDVTWTNGVNLTRDQLTTMGGSQAFLPAVRGGQLMRSFGSPALTTGLTLDTVIGLTRYTQGSSFIYVEPINTAESSRPFAA